MSSLTPLDAFIGIGQAGAAFIVQLLIAVGFFTALFGVLIALLAYVMTKKMTPLLAKQALQRAVWIAHFAVVGVAFAYVGASHWLFPVALIGSCLVNALDIASQHETGVTAA